MSIKKKLKRAVKKTAPLLAVAGLGKAFMDARKRKNEMKEFLATEGGNLADMRDYGPFSKKRGFVPVNMMTAKDAANDPFFINAETLMNDQRMFKKGGRVKKGFAKKKKQANKMRKK